MRSLPFKKLDAFATAQSAGNPAAALYLENPDDLSGDQMQRVARELKGFVSEVGFTIDMIAVYTSEVADSANRLRSRVFAAPFGYLEDPATGSANAALGYHLLRAGAWDGAPMRIEQGPDRLRPNIVRLASVADEDHGLRVVFGGGAIVRIEGRYLVRD